MRVPGPLAWSVGQNKRHGTTSHSSRGGGQFCPSVADAARISNHGSMPGVAC